MLSMHQCLPIHSLPQIFHWSSLQSINGLPVTINIINICNLSLHCFNAVKCAKCASNNSTAEISVKFLSITTVRIWVLFFSLAVCTCLIFLSLILFSVQQTDRSIAKFTTFSSGKGRTDNARCRRAVDVLPPSLSGAELQDTDTFRHLLPGVDNLAGLECSGKLIN